MKGREKKQGAWTKVQVSKQPKLGGPHQGNETLRTEPSTSHMKHIG